MADASITETKENSPAAPSAMPGQRPFRVNWWLVAMLAGTLPYAVVKVLWFGGHYWGIPDDSPARSGGFVLANAVTLAIDVVGVVLVWALASGRIGPRRVRWWAIPMWVGAGFLAPVAVQVPVGFAAGLLRAGRPVAMVGGLVDDWTYVVVYTSFFVQALVLLGLLATRLPGLLDDRSAGQARVRDGSTDATLRVIAVIAGGVAGGAMVVTALLAPAGWHVSSWTFDNRFGLGLRGALVLAGCAGLCWPSVRFATVAGWLGTGVGASYGAATTIGVLGGTALGDAVPTPERMVHFTALVFGAAGAIVLAHRHERARSSGLPAARGS